MVEPLLNSIGRGGTGTLIAGVWAVTSLLWWAVWFWGAQWRKEKEEKSRRKMVGEEDVCEAEVKIGEKTEITADVICVTEK